MPHSPSRKLRQQLDAEDLAQVAKVLALTTRRLKARPQRFTPFGLLVETPWVRLTLEREEPKGAKNIEAYPVSRVGDYLQINLGPDDWLCWYTQSSFKRFSGSVRLHRVVCAVAGIRLDDVEVKPGLIEKLDVHHLDINPLNNRVSNLLPVRPKVHTALHYQLQREDVVYAFPSTAWLKVVYLPHTKGQERLEALIVDRLWWGPRRAATAAQIAAIVGDAGRDGITRSAILERAKVQKLGESTTKNTLVALVRAGILGKAGHDRYIATYDDAEAAT